MKNKSLLVIISVVVVAFICIAALGSRVIGVSSGQIERDARKNQKIAKSWPVSQAVTDEMAALLFYDKESDEHSFSIYLNNGGFSFGYFLRESGFLDVITSGVQGLSYQGSGMALFSMNAKLVEKIRMDDGQSVETIAVDPLKPFAVIVPPSIKVVSLYNSSGEEVSIDNIASD